MNFISLILAANLTRDQLRVITDNSSQYSISEVHEAVERLRLPLPPLPEHPTDYYIANNPSRYGIFEVKHAIDRIKQSQHPSGTQ